MKHLNISIKKFLLIFVSMVLFGLLIYHLGAKYFFGAEIQTAEYGQAVEAIETTGIFLRDEIVLKDDSYNQNNLKYLLSDGEKIAKNGIIAEVYSSSEDAKTSYKIDDVNKKIEILEKLNLTKYNIFKGINFINNQINEEIKNLLVSFGSCKFLDFEDERQKILYLLSERQIILGENINLDEKLEKLNSEKSSLLSSFSKRVSVINSPESGDFVNYTDDYEDLINYKDILHSNFDGIDFKSIKNRSLKGTDIHIIGKIIKSEEWYIICDISAEKAGKIYVGEELKISIPSSESFLEIPCTVAAINKKSNSDDFALIISCNYMDKNLSRVRKDDIKIILNEYSGLKIKKSAIHKYPNEEKEGEFFVYVKSGEYLEMRKVKILFGDENHVICSYNAGEMLDDSYLQIGNNVVSGGTNLYEGKRV